MSIGILFFLIFLLITRKTHLAGLLSLWSIILFFSYGYVFSENFGLILWGLVWLIGCVLMIKFVKADGRLSLVLNIVGLFFTDNPTFSDYFF